MVGRTRPEPLTHRRWRWGVGRRSGLDWQTSGHLLELDVGDTGACERVLRVQAMCVRLSVVCSIVVEDAPYAALVLGRLAG